MNSNINIIRIIQNPRSIRPEKIQPLFVLIALVILALFHFIFDFVLITFEINISRDNFENMSIISLLSALIIAPILEEIIFRTHLSGKPFHSWSILLMYVTFVIVNTNENKVLLIVFLSLIPLIIYGLFSEKILALILRRYFNFLFYITVVLFAMMHFSIVQNDIQKGFIVSAFVTLFAFVPVGVVLGIIRRKYGLLSSIIFHSLNNITILSLNFLYVTYGI